MFIIQRTRVASVAAAVFAAAALAAPAAAAERLTDKDMKQLIERIDNERDRFEDQLDGKVKTSIIRNAAGETDVTKYLDDFQDNVQKLKDRYTTSYAAGAEATTVLRQASEIKRFMATQPAGFDGASEWNRLEASLGELAAAYSTTLPIPEGQQARRLNDAEVRAAANGVAKSADQFKKALDASLKADTSVDKARARRRSRSTASKRTRNLASASATAGRRPPRPRRCWSGPRPCGGDGGPHAPGPPRRRGRGAAVSAPWHKCSLAGLVGRISARRAFLDGREGARRAASGRVEATSWPPCASRSIGRSPPRPSPAAVVTKGSNTCSSRSAECPIRSSRYRRSESAHVVRSAGGRRSARAPSPRSR